MSTALKMIACLALVALAGCAELTPRERTALKVASTVLVVGAIAAHQANHGGTSRRTLDPVTCVSGQCQ